MQMRETGTRYSSARWTPVNICFKLERGSLGEPLRGWTVVGPWTVDRQTDQQTDDEQTVDRQWTDSGLAVDSG